jgi:Bax protein
MRMLALLTVVAVGIGIAALVLTAREPLPDFRQYAAGEERKQAFFDYMTPVIEASNARILALRERLQTIDPNAISGGDKRWLDALSERYDVVAEDPEERIQKLLLRVDVVPVSLALAQAAKESAWGTSRFAREGNNLFGEWCFSKGCGLVPSKRTAGRTHEVRAFKSPGESIDSYLLNLNTHPAYREMRLIRKSLRENDSDILGRKLAQGLARYSERGEIYVTEVQNLIASNDLE